MAESMGGLLFDLDGTLIDTAPDMGGALNRLLQEEGEAPLSAAEIRPHVSHGSKALVALGFGSNLSAEAESALIARYLDCYSRCLADNSVLFPGMDDMLRRLEEQGIPWGIITNKPARYAVPLVQLLNLSERCSTLVCGDSMAIRKPDPSPIWLACRRVGLSPDRCVYVGDAERDIAAGAAAGMPTVLMSWGYFAEGEDTGAWGADWACADAEELWQVCQQTGLTDAAKP